MKYRVDNVELWLDESDELLGVRAAKRLGVTQGELASVRIARSALDARKKGSPRFMYTLEVELEGGRALASLPSGIHPVEAPPPPPPRVKAPRLRPVIVGAGPAGLFCALGL
ncbi:MAG: NAD(P)/FAD-dependent oxidoreductase, partial [Myxococcaceae bacterium]